MKTIGIIGLGKFGYHIAEALSKLEDVVVIAVDRDEKIVQEISEHIENAFVLDSTDAHALEEVGMFELDTVIISIGEDLEASILTVMAVKSLRNKHIIAKDDFCTIQNNQIMIGIKIFTYFNVITVITPKWRGDAKFIFGLAKQFTDNHFLLFTIGRTQLIVVITTFFAFPPLFD